jgi:hypothetical protein
MKTSLTHFFSRGLLVNLLLGSLFSVNAIADLPKTLSIQGQVENIYEGTNLQGNFDVRFTLYDTTGRNTEYMTQNGTHVDPTGSGASVVWTNVISVPFEDGKYSVQLGAIIPFPADAFLSKNEVLGIQISDDIELTPRMTLNAIPYSIRSSVSTNVDGDITPRSVSVADASGNLMLVIDEDGHWLGNSSGLEGATGPKGDTGDTGPQGIAGATGPKGDAGPQGIPGATGPKGDTGDAGIQGPAGVTGLQGIPGATGPKGDTGDAGIQGPAGVTGLQGIAGATGPKGDTGDAGIQGPAGIIGLQGIAGATGPKGDIGATGPKGDIGATGPKGDTGETGPKGDTGETGPKGDTGATGSQGLPGPAGSIGSNTITTKQCTTGTSCACETNTRLITAGASCAKNQYLYKSQPVLNSKTTWEAVCEVFSTGADANPASINLICASDNDA